MTATQRVGLIFEREEKQHAAARCAWCDQETGRKPDSGGNESHTVCGRHLQQIREGLERERERERQQFNQHEIITH